jgi:hypothetical protein
MDLDGSLSTEVAIIKDRQDYNDIVTWASPSATTVSRCQAKPRPFAG